MGFRSPCRADDAKPFKGRRRGLRLVSLGINVMDAVSTGVESYQAEKTRRVRLYARKYRSTGRVDYGLPLRDLSDGILRCTACGRDVDLAAPLGDRRGSPPRGEPEEWSNAVVTAAGCVCAWCVKTGQGA